MKLLYFAWVREGLGKNTETLEPPESIGTVRDLLTWLQSQGPDYERTLKDTSRLRVAVNQTHAALDHPVTAQDEVAIFPPVTGG